MTWVGRQRKPLDYPAAGQRYHRMIITVLSVDRSLEAKIILQSIALVIRSRKKCGGELGIHAGQLLYCSSLAFKSIKNLTDEETPNVICSTRVLNKFSPCSFVVELSG
jgi:hypothetical protein